MTTDTEPVFANTCGIIFTDHLVFASSNRESVFKLSGINKIRFKKRYKTASIAFTFLPGILLLVPYFSGNEDTFVKLLFIGIGVAGLAVSVANIQAGYTLNIDTTTNGTHAIAVWEGNKSDAQKFTDKANAFILKYKAASAQTPGYNTGLDSADPVAE